MYRDVYHNSYLEEYRSPFGAVKCGEKVTLRLRASVGYYGDCVLRLWANDREQLVSMNRVEVEGAQEKYIWFEGTFNMPKKPGLVWYYFCLQNDHETYYLGNSYSMTGGEGAIYEHAPMAYQITCYNETKSPAWFKHGRMYQIFPDRFCNGNDDMRINSPKKGSLLQATWDDAPSYQKDRDGKIMSWIFAGGNLKGIIKKLDYLQSLGITVVYLNPIFEAASNHRYDTADYLNVDPVLGTNEDFAEMVAEGKKRGINFILDGVFSHTGQDSIYFNKSGNYGEGGAYNDVNSPYHKWYKFKNFPTEYECWWDFDELPNVNELEESYLDFICRNEDSVVRTWIRRGAMGFRFDVADELPDEFIKELRKAIKEENSEAVLIGEVWEDASNKQAYGIQREYFYGEELDGVMNYPFRDALLGFGLGKISSFDAAKQIMSIMENYPKENLLASMNMLSTHDRPRSLTVLGGVCSDKGEDYIELTDLQKIKFKLTKEQELKGLRKLKMLSALLYALPGIPSIYYGEEVGMQGFMDPYNRGTFPWGKERGELTDWYRSLNDARENYMGKFIESKYYPILTDNDLLGFKSEKDGEWLYVLANRHEEESRNFKFEVDVELTYCMELTEGKIIEPQYLRGEIASFDVDIAPLSTRIFLLRKKFAVQRLERGAGVLMHITSLNGDFFVGDMGKCAYDFVDFLERAKQKLWQVLPLAPTGCTNSPYYSSCALAGNPIMISLEKIAELGLIKQSEIDSELAKFTAKHPKIKENRVPCAQVTKIKMNMISKAYEVFLTQNGAKIAEEFEKYIAENNYWVRDYALYQVIKQKSNDLPWYEWTDLDLRFREKAAIEAAYKKYEKEVNYFIFEQFLFDKQWAELSKYANSKGVSIIGDAPIYVAGDSLDVWANQELFKLDESGEPLKVGGCPPDFFSDDGQFWGNPVFDWEAHKKEKYNWWKQRLRRDFSHADFIRLDHFRGFSAYYEISAKEETARNGSWVRGGGVDFFASLTNDMGALGIIAEDLGHITADVNNLKNYFGYKGMEIFQFSESLKAGFIELEHLKNSILYTGTHDNKTLLEFIQETTDLEGEEQVEEIYSIIESLYKSDAPWVIVPIQDILGLGADSKMNVPGTVSEDNWSWKMTAQDDRIMNSADILDWLEKLVVDSDRD